MQQVFLIKAKKCFSLIEVFIALLLFSMIIAPFIATPMQSLKKSRDHLIVSELQRADTLIYAELLKKAHTATMELQNGSILFDPIFVDVEPLGVFEYNIHCTKKCTNAKVSGTTLVKTKLYFTPGNKYLPTPKPYTHYFMVKNKESDEYNPKQ